VIVGERGPGVVGMAARHSPTAEVAWGTWSSMLGRDADVPFWADRRGD
jgi:hypothetical protein